ncbi:MAG: molybdate ABC transporter substrate-binding protein [Chamaesiphon sp.]|nr:molybdate ABC transporter substrate-binding protein [Chamaesiphon sp.]
MRLVFLARSDRPVQMVLLVSRKYLKATLLSFLVSLGLIAFSIFREITQPASSQSSELLVAAAASIQPALQEITPLYEKSSTNRQVKYNFGSSGALQQQIEQGAPIDIFISAASKQMDKLEQQNLLVTKTRNNLLTNILVLVSPTTSKLKLTNFSQLLKPEIQRIAIGEPRSVPVGQYAVEVLKNLNILDRVKSKLVLGNNVRSVLAAVETGDADAGIVYVSDAKSSNKVMVSGIADTKLHAPIVYPIAILNSTKALESAKQYIKFLQTKPAQLVFKKYGFGIAKS